MKQKVCMPSYWEKFSCTSSKCEETCCAGWYIAIDEASYKKYKKVKHPEMKKRLDKEIVARKGSISQDCVAKIKLKNNRCAFLNTENLCDIYKHLGENYLSETCKVYPRNINKVGENLELSLALSCPEAARIILTSKEQISFTEEEDKWHLPVVGGTLNVSGGKLKHFEDGILGIRKQLISMLQNRSYSFEERWLSLKQGFMQLDEIKKKQDLKALDHFIQNGPKKVVMVKKPMNALGQEERLKGYFMALQAMRKEKKWPSARYEACYEQMVSGLSVCKEEKLHWASEKYALGAKRLNEKLRGDWQLIFENYFVSYVYERLVPLDQKSPKESFKQMESYLDLLSLHLCGMLVSEEVDMEEAIITLIQSFTRVFDHNEQCMEQLKKYCINDNTK